MEMIHGSHAKPMRAPPRIGLGEELNSTPILRPVNLQKAAAAQPSNTSSLRRCRAERRCRTPRERDKLR
jgi:hypothetical protein